MEGGAATPLHQEGDGVVDADAREAQLPADIGLQATLVLLEEIKQGGVVDYSHQVLRICSKVASPRMPLASTSSSAIFKSRRKLCWTSLEFMMSDVASKQNPWVPTAGSHCSRSCHESSSGSEGLIGLSETRYRIRLRSTFSRQSVLSIVSASAIRAMMTKTTLLLVATLVIVVAARSPVAAQPPPAEAKAVITVTNLSPVEVLLFQILAGKLNPMDTVPANTSQFMIRNFQAVDGQVDLLVQSTALGVTSQVGRVLTLSNFTNIAILVNSAATGLVATITGFMIETFRPSTAK
ncbi:hypothetical protein AXG93_4476s1030 [Marchantia polymorpha subsp. ruderalis]|uniref:Uncharacterized protein n=1 Tax=Marchantia polymorpha subsp. ruderalis TaxID=1480154 RepID=A0A176W5F1_MARPO|nr:hypothetical protein AXG93_4476s1030 [Marchantia polymorpha subsp. ruderalis]